MEIWPTQFPAQSFSQLRILQVQKCDKLLEFIPSNLLQQLQNLEAVSVRECDRVEEVIQLEGANVVVLSQLRRLELCNLPKLVEMWWNKDCNGILSCPNLNYLEVYGCNSLRNLFLSSVAKGFVNLRVLDVSDCLNMEEVVAKEKLGEDFGDKLAFPSICILKLVNLPKLRSFYSGNLTLECLSLSNMDLENCPDMYTFSSGLLITPMLSNIRADGKRLWEGNLNSSIQQHIFRFRGVQVVFPSLENLYLSGLKKVKEMWHQQPPVKNLQNLKSLKIVICSGLRNVFQGLIQLQQLETSSCKIVAKESGEEEKEANDVIVFPQLQTLTLENFPELVSFYQGINYTSEKLTIEDIPKQKTFGTEKPKENDKKKMNEQGNLGAITQSPLFSEKVSTTKLDRWFSMKRSF
ncbi:hypothetical protein F0562_025687 [Nyssa sinensis]|uniref:Disease resistance protein At4g27190-like leucine-rich repeats domain-containing protein n=1 Tax=Nyssa sinensis TaxID=561372 RepID=A0A5J5B6Z9_9ASTE|nr:hypothetical protein F0562_025687 [Nyssa sinensis]